MNKRLNSLLFYLFFAVFLVVMFSEVLPYYTVLRSPDSPPYFRADYLTAWLRRLMSPENPHLFYPGLLPALALPPLIYHDWHYALCTLATCAAMIYYLRGLHLSRSACVCGGFAMAFSGYHFTLISAGHRGYFDMMPWAILMLAWVDRGLRRPRVRYPLSAAIALGFGLSSQPDVMVLCAMLIAAYALVMLVRQGVALPRPKRPAWVRRLAISSAVAMPALALALAAPLGHVFLVWMPGREAQIAESAAPRGTTQAVEADQPVSPEAAWIFATNWSLPPGEALEFVAPFFFGIESFHPEEPYWGALGRPPQAQWEGYRQQVEAHLAAQVPAEQQAKQRDELLSRARNYRQHTTYLGAIPLVFVLAAFCWALPQRRRRSGSDRDTADDDDTRLHQRIAARFWIVAGVVSLLLAFGRYTPVYRLFYHLPYLSHLRAPVKFLHLTEITVAILFAIGIQACWVAGRRSLQTAAEPRWRAALLHPAPLIGAGLAFALLLVAVVPFWHPAVRASLQAVGIHPQTVPLLMRVARQALLHGGVFAALGVGGMLLIRAGVLPRQGLPIALCLLPCLALDALRVGRPFMTAIDVSAIYRSNPVIEAIRAPNPDVPNRVSNLLGGHKWQDPLTGALRHYAIPRTEPASMDGPYGELYRELSQTPAQLWSETGTRFILGPGAQLERLNQHPDFDLLLGFDLDALGRVRAVADQGRFWLVERRNAEPFAQVYYDWKVVAAGEALNRLLERSPGDAHRIWIETDADLPDPTAPALPPETAIVHRRTGNSALNRMRIEARTTAPAMLLMRQGFREPRALRVNGAPATLVRANHAWSAIPLPDAGTHQVRIDYGFSVWRLATGLGALLLLILANALRTRKT